LKALKARLSTAIHPENIRNIQSCSKVYREEFGIQNDPATANKPRTKLPRLPNTCFYVGDGHIGMELTDQTLTSYTKLGFNINNLCMVLTSGQIRFNPETGERLPTYVIADDIKDMKGPGKPGTALSDEYLFIAPECFSKGNTVVQPDQFSAEMKPVGCKVNYHPWSGRKLGPEEVEFFTREARLGAAGDAGDVLEDSHNIAKDQSRAASAAKLQAIKLQASK